MSVNRRQATLLERLTDLRAERRRIEYRAEQGKPISVHHLRAYVQVNKRIEQYERDLNAIEINAKALNYARVNGSMMHKEQSIEG